MSFHYQKRKCRFVQYNSTSCASTPGHTCVLTSLAAVWVTLSNWLCHRALQDFSAFGDDDSEVPSLFIFPCPPNNYFSLSDLNVLMLLDVSGSDEWLIEIICKTLNLLSSALISSAHCEDNVAWVISPPKFQNFSDFFFFKNNEFIVFGSFMYQGRPAECCGLIPCPTSGCRQSPESEHGSVVLNPPHCPAPQRQFIVSHPTRHRQTPQPGVLGSVI